MCKGIAECFHILALRGRVQRPVDRRHVVGVIPANRVHNSHKKCAIHNSLDGSKKHYVFESSDEASDGCSERSND